MSIKKTSITVFTSAFLLPIVIFAQDTDSKKIDDTELISLYASLQQMPNDEFLLTRIKEERENIRNLIEVELNTLVKIPDDEEVIDDSGELSRVLDRQRNIISALQERIRERKIDLELLEAEENRFYINLSGTGQGIAQFKTTSSYPQLLARRAILEERIAMLQILLPHQQERLRKLIAEERRQQFGSFLDIGTYVLILLFIWLVEKIIRRFILVKIPNPTVRYSAIKFFTGGVYILTILWIFSIIYARNPNILASFAIVGAGIAIALQDVIKDVVGWFVIHQSGLFSQGDRISIGLQTGEVIDIGLLHTKVLEIGMPPDGVLEQTGKVLSIPNGQMLTASVNNYNLTSDYVKAEMIFAVTFESDYRKAEEIVQAILDAETSEFAERDRLQHHMRTRTMYIPYEPSDPKVFKSIAADGVELILRFAVPIGSRRSTVSKITDKILEKFDAEPDVNLAYTTSRILAEVKG